MLLHEVLIISSSVSDRRKVLAWISDNTHFVVALPSKCSHNKNNNNNNDGEQ